MIWKREEGWTLTNVDPMIILIDKEKAVKLTRIRVAKLPASELEEIGNNFLNLTKYIFKRYKKSLQLIAVSMVKYRETAL